jgi:multiple sugar transport system substrate-binding protein
MPLNPCSAGNVDLVKRAAIWVRGVVVASLLFTCACQNVADNRITLRVANWGAAGDDSEFYKLVRQLHREFEEQNPDIRIQIEGIPGSQEYVSKVLLSHVARTAPDVITLDASSSAVFIDNAVVRDLAPYAAADAEFSWDDYHPNVVDIARRGEAIYAVPMDFTPMVVYYNMDLFDAAGVPYPKPGWTTAEFLETAKRLTTKDRFGFKFINWMPGWVMWLWNRGGQDVLRQKPDGSYTAVGVFDSPENIATVIWLRDLIKVHKVAPSLSMTASTGVDPFANGSCAMEISGHWAMVGYASAQKLKLERIGVAPLPSDMPKSHTVMYESGLAIGKHCKHPEAAWKFIRFMTSESAQRRYHSQGIAISARKDVSKERATDPREQMFIDIVPSARAPWGAKVQGYDLVEDIGQKMMDAVLKAGVAPETALRQAARDIDKELARR